MVVGLAPLDLQLTPVQLHYGGAIGQSAAMGGHERINRPVRFGLQNVRCIPESDRLLCCREMTLCATFDIVAVRIIFVRPQTASVIRS